MNNDLKWSAAWGVNPDAGWVRFDGLVDPEITFSASCLVCHRVWAFSATPLQQLEHIKMLGEKIEWDVTHHEPCEETLRVLRRLKDPRAL